MNSINKLLNNFSDIILEDGHNTDYIYSLIIALFYTHCDGINKLLNDDITISDGYYIQEFIKTKFIYNLQKNISIMNTTINKFRMYLYYCGWLKNESKHILDKCNIKDFYLFLFKLLEYEIIYAKIDNLNNTTSEYKCKLIEITDEIINIEKENEINNTLNLTNLINIWVKQNITLNKQFNNNGENTLNNSINEKLNEELNKGLNEKILEQYSYRFDKLPYLLPIYINRLNNNNIKIDIMRGFKFIDNGDKIQRMFIWELHSLICKSTKDDSYYAIVITGNNKFRKLSDKMIPSNIEINMKDDNVRNKIMMEVCFVFYKI